MPRGASPKREREYKELKSEFKEEGRYKGREEEVAARIVNKQRSQYGETKEEKKKDRQGKSPDRNLPVENYDKLTISQISGKLKDLSRRDIKKLRDYEAKNKSRKGMMEKLEKALESR